MKKIELTVGKCDMDAMEELLYSRGVKTYVTVEFIGAHGQGEESGEGDGARETRIEFYLSDIDLGVAVVRLQNDAILID
jgi:nitrogen regulatory protein PII